MGRLVCHLRGVLRAWERVSTPPQYKWFYTHGRYKWREYQSVGGHAIQKKFFDHFLKGIDSGIMETARVRLEVRENLYDSIVRYENEWPIARTKYTKLHLDAATGTLNFDRVRGPRTISYNSEDPNSRALFKITFDKDTELTGQMKLKLWVSPNNANDMDLFVTLRKLDAYGHEVRFDAWEASGYWSVDLGWLRLSWRELDKKESRPWPARLHFEK